MIRRCAGVPDKMLKEYLSAAYSYVDKDINVKKYMFLKLCCVFVAEICGKN